MEKSSVVGMDLVVGGNDIILSNDIEYIKNQSILCLSLQGQEALLGVITLEQSKIASE